MPIVADESRTFGMEGMFRQLGIYSSVGQLYHPQDAEQLMWYREDKLGQILQEGINEAGAISSWIAAGTSYSNHDLPMIPFYIFYSMFGFQRVGDLAWAAGDSRTRGFLLGATSGRTTLNGEGLQHEDGSSQVAASFIPNCRSYDPTYSYEVAVDHSRRLAPHAHRAGRRLLLHHAAERKLPRIRRCRDGARDGILRGMYSSCADGGETAQSKTPRVQLFGSGAILREVLAAAELLAERMERTQRRVERARASTSCSATASRRARWNMLHPTEKPRLPYVEQCLQDRAGPGDRRDRLHPHLRRADPAVRRGAGTSTLGTDGYGRSDFRRKLREFFEVDRHFVTRRGAASARRRRRDRNASVVEKAIEKYAIDPEQAQPDDRVEGASMSETIEVRVPDIGDFKDVPVIEVLVKPGDRVKKNDSLVTLESEKASMEVPAEAEGVVQDVKVKVGDKVSKGATILMLKLGESARTSCSERRPSVVEAAA